MKKIFAVMLAVLMMASLLCACGEKTFKCDCCGENKKSKEHKIELFGVEMVVCEDCRDEIEEGMDELGDLDIDLDDLFK
ncbi:MAG: hypothetical protein IJ426_07350 [Clostridia bacterium]|nr:hypothetical protein [Clostridia bacterium]